LRANPTASAWIAKNCWFDWFWLLFWHITIAPAEES